MMINKTNVKAILDISTTNYDNTIDLLLPVFINSVVKYCKNYFIMQKQSGKIETTEDTILFDKIIELPFKPGDFVALGLSLYNKEVYQIEALTANSITINNKYELVEENSYSGYLGFVRFPTQLINIIADYFKVIIEDNQNIKSEKLGDHAIEYSNVNTDDFINYSSNKLQHFRNVFSDMWVNQYYGY